MSTIKISDLHPTESELLFYAELSPEEAAAIIGGWGFIKKAWNWVKDNKEVAIGVGIVAAGTALTITSGGSIWLGVGTVGATGGGAVAGGTFN